MKYRRLVTAVAAAGALASSSRAQSQLAGHYVLSQRTVVRADIPILPDLLTETWSVALLRLDASAERLNGRGKLCRIEMSTSSSLVRMELPPAFQRLVSEVHLDARLEERSNGLALEEVPRVQVLGATLKDPEHEPLPRDASDRRVIDQDGDGHPGVTVRVRGIVNGEVFVVQRGVARLRGQSDPLGFHGAVVFRTEDAVLGASKPVLTRRTPVRPDLERSTFVLRKVPAQTDCAAAIELARRVHPGS